jgi:phage terminase small subunit
VTGTDSRSGTRARRARISARLREIQNAVSARTVEKTSVTKAWVIAKLVENVDRAMQITEVLDAKGNPRCEFTYQGNVANRALELLDKEQGMFVERKGVGGPGAFSELNDEELQQAIIEQTRELAELDPEFAEFARQLAPQKRATKH